MVKICRSQISQCSKHQNLSKNPINVYNVKKKGFKKYLCIQTKCLLHASSPALLRFQITQKKLILLHKVKFYTPHTLQSTSRIQ